MAEVEALKAEMAEQGEIEARVGAELRDLLAKLPNIPDGLLLFATVKRELGQMEQAEDAARRHVARRPEDVRGAKLLAMLEAQRMLAEKSAAAFEAQVAAGLALATGARPRTAGRKALAGYRRRVNANRRRLMRK